MFEASVVSVHIPPAFRGYVGGHDEVLVSAETVGELLEAVGHEYPSFIAKAMSADGGLAPGLQLFLAHIRLPTHRDWRSPSPWKRFSASCR